MLDARRIPAVTEHEARSIRYHRSPLTSSRETERLRILIATSGPIAWRLLQRTGTAEHLASGAHWRDGMASPCQEFPSPLAVCSNDWGSS
jgi:hypothetical protein